MTSRQSKRRASNKRYYQKNRTRLKSHAVRKAREAKSAIVVYKGDKCCDCGYTFHDSVYDMHHRDPKNKSFNISGSNISSMEWSDVLLEADKCDLLCSNCHRMRHATGNLAGVH